MRRTVVAYQDVLSAYSTTNVVLTGLSTSTTYDVYIVAEDTQSPSNVQDAVELLTFVTTDEVDSAAPVWGPGEPGTANVGHVSVDLTASLNEPGTVFFLVRCSFDTEATGSAHWHLGVVTVCTQVLHRGVPPPSASQVKDGSVNPAFLAVPPSQFDVPAPSSSVSHTVADLEPSSELDVYFVAQDAQAPPNLQASPTLVMVDTAGEYPHELCTRAVQLPTPVPPHNALTRFVCRGR